MVVARGVPYSPPNPLLACVTRAQAGDAAAFTELVRDHQHAIYSLVLGIVRNTEDAGDIVQDVWVKVARHLPQLREPERFVPWLYRIARNCSMDFCNSRKKRPQLAYRRDDEHEDDPFDVPDSSTYVPEQQLLSLDERRKVWEALGALSEADRTVLFLRESRELPYAEIARILGISCNAAEVRVFRARERFRKQFIEVEEAAPECNVSPLQLGAFVDGELGDATYKMLERHIHSCEECTSRLTAIESGRTLYRGLGLFLMPSGLTAGLLSSLPSLGFASAATAAAATSAAVATATIATGATGAAVTSATFGASIAAAVAAVAVTGTVAVEYTDLTSAAQTAPPAAVLEIAAPPAPPVAIVFAEPAASAAAAQTANEVLAALPVPLTSIPPSGPAVLAADESPSEPASATAPTSAPSVTTAVGGHKEREDGRGSDSTTTTAATGERDRANAGASTVIVAIAVDERGGRGGDRGASKDDNGRSDQTSGTTTGGNAPDSGPGGDSGGRGNDGGGHSGGHGHGR